MPSESIPAALIPATGEKWESLSLSVGGVDSVADTIATITGAIGTSIEIQKTILQIISALALDILNIEAALINAALGAVESVLEQFIGTPAKIHALVVPIRKQTPYNLASEHTMPQLENSWEISDELSDEFKADFKKTLDEVAHYDQGNRGYARTVIESMSDEFDDNRPQYDKDAAIYAVVVVAGAQTILGIYDLLRSLQGIFGASLKGNKMLPDTVTVGPQDLRATIISAPGKPEIGVRLAWKNPPTLQSLAEFDGTRVRIDEVAIIRSDNDEIATAKDWSAIFAGDQPTALGDDDFEVDVPLQTGDNTDTKVLKIFKYDGIRDSYIDTDDLVKYRDYYYFVAYRYSFANKPPPQQSKLIYVQQSYQQISNIVKVRAEETVPSTKKGPKPDWTTHPSLLDLLPDLKFFLDLIKNFVTGLRSQATGAASALKSYIDFLDAEATRYLDYAEDINNKVAKLASLIQLPATGIYITTIDSPKGGNEFFQQELVRRLTDETDTTAPPFFHNGLTAGLVILAGAPNPANLQPVKDLLALVSGLSEQTPFEDAVAEIDRVVTTLEDDFTFRDDMQPFTSSTLAAVASEEHEAKTKEFKTFDDAMNETDADDPDANVPFDP